MRTTLLAALALVAVAVPARAAGPVDPAAPQGAKCRFDSNTDVTTNTQTQVGYATGGPLVVAGVGPVTVTCTIFVNGVAATSVSGNPVAVGTITYQSNVTDIVDLCTSVTYGGHTYWYAPSSDPLRAGTWSEQFRDSSSCGVSLMLPDIEECPVLLTIDKYAGTPLAAIWQDCEPYSPLF